MPAQLLTSSKAVGAIAIIAIILAGAFPTSATAQSNNYSWKPSDSSGHVLSSFSPQYSVTSGQCTQTGNPTDAFPSPGPITTFNGGDDMFYTALMSPGPSDGTAQSVSTSATQDSVGYFAYVDANNNAAPNPPSQAAFNISLFAESYNSATPESTINSEISDAFGDDLLYDSIQDSNNGPNATYNHFYLAKVDDNVAKIDFKTNYSCTIDAGTPGWDDYSGLAYSYDYEN
jgi:hypothetical protein